MNYSVPGSSILLIFLLTMVLGISIMNIMRSTTYMLDIAHKREQYDQQYYATEGLLNYGIACAIELDIKQDINPMVIDVGTWPPQSKNNYHGKLEITQTNAVIHIQSFLMKSDIPICVLSCKLTKQKNNVLLGSVEKEWFVISNFQHTFF